MATLSCPLALRYHALYSPAGRGVEVPNVTKPLETGAGHSV